ncbi:galectin-3b isoform X2 [Hoplias malabaricus]|uniref:galectin-3b isoform X2 n=1 Tax=Hoplias malabaricus TaxID=27720 RepID=UPI0034633E4F
MALLDVYRRLLADALDSGATQSNNAGGPTWPGQPAWPGQPGMGQPGQPAWPGQPGQPAWPGQPGQPTWPGQPGPPVWPGQPGQPTWPVQPNQPTAPGWPGPTPPTAPQTTQSLTVPFSMALPRGVFDKMLITIQGEVKPNAKAFTIDLTRQGDLAFHFNPRFNENGRQVIVRNSMIGKQWGKEERSASSFPFAPGKPFELKILCTSTEFKVAVNKSHLLEFKHRVRELNQINQLSVFNDVTLSSVNLETLP